MTSKRVRSNPDDPCGTLCMEEAHKAMTDQPKDWRLWLGDLRAMSTAGSDDLEALYTDETEALEAMQFIVGRLCDGFEAVAGLVSHGHYTVTSGCKILSQKIETDAERDARITRAILGAVEESR